MQEKSAKLTVEIPDDLTVIPLRTVSDSPRFTFPKKRRVGIGSSSLPNKTLEITDVDMTVPHNVES